MTVPSLTPEGDIRARRLYWRLLASYLGVTVAVFGSGAIALYAFVSHAMRQELKEELKVLAEAAAPSLDLAETQSEFFTGQAAADHWHALEQHSQSLEWYDADGRLLVREGKVFSSLPLPEAAELDVEGLVERDYQQQLYVATLPVYEEGSVAGIVRASEAVRVIEKPLTQLRWGLVIGGAVGLGAIVLSGLWLSRLALEPFVQSYRRLRQFTADASHEMRSPLAVIQAAIDMISDHSEGLPEAERANISRIGSATQKLRRLTESLLKLARSDETVKPTLQTIPLHELLQDLVDALEEVAAERGVQLLTRDLESVSVRGDNAQLVQLFTNLLDNGIKYTPNGGSVTVKLSRANNQAIAVVADTGVGIAPDDIPHVFERFWQADKARSRQTDGLGLGLAIAHDIAKRHNSNIYVRSQVGRGSKFEVSLPAITG